MSLNTAQRHQIRQIFEKFIRNRVRTIRSLRIEDLNINPFLIRILAKEMGLNDAKSIVGWLVSQRLERGTVTSFGIALQSAAKVFSEGTGDRNVDERITLSMLKRGVGARPCAESGSSNPINLSGSYVPPELRPRM